jgi:DNA-binding CsgD family transcriptional regulator
MVKKSIFVLAFVITFLSSAFADESSPVASRAVANRVENGQTIFYASLIDAVNAASSDEVAAGTSLNNPDEIVLLDDCTLESSVIIPDGTHIRLVSNDGEKIIRRGANFLTYPLFQVQGIHSSLSLGKPEMAGSIVVDGAYLNTPSVEANAPLVSVNGLYSKLFMYDNVVLQNNYNKPDRSESLIYQQIGAGVLIRSHAGVQEEDSQAEFIMKGGIIRGNVNNQHATPTGGGGGVTVGDLSKFTMEGGVIMNNTAYNAGGAVYLCGLDASFRKTGGIIYGKDAPEDYRNIAINGFYMPHYYGHAVAVPLLSVSPLVQYRDDTVDENDNLSYIGARTGIGVFGEGDHWDNPVKKTLKRLIIIISSVIVAFMVLFIVIKIHRRRKAMSLAAAKDPNIIARNANLSSRESEILAMLFTDAPIKQIAYDLELTYSGVNFHVKNIYQKLGVKNRTELLVKFAKKG